MKHIKDKDKEWCARFECKWLLEGLEIQSRQQDGGCWVTAFGSSFSTVSELVSLAILKLFRLNNGQKLAKFRKFWIWNATYLTPKMTSNHVGLIDNDPVKSAVINNLSSIPNCFSSLSRSHLDWKLTEIFSKHWKLDLEIWPFWPWRWPQMF